VHFRKIHRKALLAKRHLAVIASEEIVDVVPPHDLPMLRLDALDLSSEPIQIPLYRVLDEQVGVTLAVPARRGKASVIADPSAVVVVREQVVGQAGHAASRKDLGLEESSRPTVPVAEWMNPRQVIGEAKATTRMRTVADLNRLESIRADLEKRGESMSRSLRYLLFGLMGFDRGLRHLTATRDDVELVDLDRLYEGT